MTLKRILSISFAIALCFSASYAQTYKRAAQAKFIPAELGAVYLGMPLKQFAAKMPVDGAEIDGRFDWLEITVPFKKGNVTGVTVRVHGLNAEEKASLVRKGQVTDKNDLGETYEREADLLNAAKIPNKGIVYAMYLSFKDDFDLKGWSGRAYGRPGDVYKKGDEYHFYDHQWTRRSGDGLTWLIRAYFDEKGKSLQLLGRIKGTEWDADM